LDGETALAVVKQVHANDLGDVFAVAEIGGRVIGECGQETYAFMVVFAHGEEVESFVGDILSGADFLEGFAAWTGRPELHRLADFDSATPAMILAADVPHKTLRPGLDWKRHEHVLNRTAYSREPPITLSSRR